MSPRVLLSIGQVAKLTEIPVHTVRRMCDQGMLAYTLTEKGHRRFTIGCVEKFQRIVKKYRDMGLSYLPEATKTTASGG